MKEIITIEKEITDYILETSLSDSKDINVDTLIFDTGLLDSMGLLFLIEFINEKYNIEVNDEELNPKNFESIKSIVSFVSTKLKINF